jgi:hypothetical protein
MLIVVPVSKTDLNLIDPFVECFNFLGQYKNHSLLVVGRKEDSYYIEYVFNKIKINFKKENQKIQTFENVPEGWPLGPNSYWKKTIEHLEKQGNTLPWLWMELDVCPLKKGWASILEKDYYTNNKPFYGCLEDTTTLTMDEELVFLTKHFVGAGIYPPNISKYSTNWKHVDRIPTAFDVICQFEFAPLSHNSELFQHNFRTDNYRKAENGEIICDDKNNFKGGRKFNKNLSSKAVILHGCKDATLYNLVFNYV